MTTSTDLYTLRKRPLMSARGLSEGAAARMRFTTPRDSNRSSIAGAFVDVA